MKKLALFLFVGSEGPDKVLVRSDVVTGIRRAVPNAEVPLRPGAGPPARRGGAGTWRMAPPRVRRANAHQTASNRAFGNSIMAAAVRSDLVARVSIIPQFFTDCWMAAPSLGEGA